jgi:hypothetical protein
MRMSSLPIIFCGRKSVSVKECSTSTAVNPRHGIILMLSANVGIKSASAFGLESSRTLSWAPICCLRGWVLNDIVVLEEVPLAVRQRLWFLHDGAPAHLGEDVQQWVDVIYPRRWTRHRGPNAWLPLSLDVTPMDFVCVWGGHLKEDVYAVLPRTIEDLVARFQAAVTTVDANMLRCARGNVVGRPAEQLL